MSFLEYRVKQAPTGLRKVLYLNWPLVVLVSPMLVALLVFQPGGADPDTASP